MASSSGLRDVSVLPATMPVLAGASVLLLGALGGVLAVLYSLLGAALGIGTILLALDALHGAGQRSRAAKPAADAQNGVVSQWQWRIILAKADVVDDFWCGMCPRGGALSCA